MTCSWRRVDFEKTGPATADVLLHIHARMEQRLDTAAFDPIDGHCINDDCRPEVYDAGTLMVDFMDRRTNRLAWRGWAERSFDGVIENQEWMEATIDKTVARILARLPRQVARTSQTCSPSAFFVARSAPQVLWR